MEILITSRELAVKSWYWVENTLRWEEKKFLILNNFCSFHNGFKNLLIQICSIRENVKISCTEIVYTYNLYFIVLLAKVISFKHLSVICLSVHHTDWVEGNTHVPWNTLLTDADSKMNTKNNNKFTAKRTLFYFHTFENIKIYLICVLL